MNDFDPVGDAAPTRGTPCPTCAAPHPTHLGWCPRWEWRDDTSHDVDGDNGGATLPDKLDTGLNENWQGIEPLPEPGDPDDFASNEPDDENPGDDRDSKGGDPLWPGFAPPPPGCGCAPHLFSVARGVCRGCGRVGPPPRCRCVECLGFTPHPAPPEPAPLTRELYARYGRALFDKPAFHRFAYLTTIDVEDVEEEA